MFTVIRFYTSGKGHFKSKFHTLIFLKCCSSLFLCFMYKFFLLVFESWSSKFLEKFERCFLFLVLCRLTTGSSLRFLDSSWSLRVNPACSSVGDSWPWAFHSGSSGGPEQGWGGLCFVLVRSLAWAEEANAEVMSERRCRADERHGGWERTLSAA